MTNYNLMKINDANLTEQEVLLFYQKVDNDWIPTYCNQILTTMSLKGVANREITKIVGQEPQQMKDLLVVEEPLEIRLGLSEADKGGYESVAVTMRTPGQDEALAAGFLFTEGMINDAAQILGFEQVTTRWTAARENVLLVKLEEGSAGIIKKVKRNFLTTSACGVCGKASIEAVHTRSSYEIAEGYPLVKASTLHSLPALISGHQSVFDCTGGLHAAALFDASGRLQLLCEDIGRHNAVDKVIGTAFLGNGLPLSEHILLVSGRAGFELVQKAVMAGIPLMAAVGAPSSLAVQLAEEAGMTLIGFLRNGQFNIYCGAERVRT